MNEFYPHFGCDGHKQDACAVELIYNQSSPRCNDDHRQGEFVLALINEPLALINWSLASTNKSSGFLYDGDHKQDACVAVRNQCG